MEITSFKPSTDRKTLELVIVDASAATSLILFTTKTYKDYNLAITLTAKLTGAATENISITLADLKQPFLDGLYFIQVEDPTETCTAITLDTTRYRECILDQVISMETCEECIKEIAKTVLATETMITAINIAVEDGYAEQAFNLVKALDKICSDACKNCGGLNNVPTTDYFTTNSN